MKHTVNEITARFEFTGQKADIDRTRCIAKFDSFWDAKWFFDLKVEHLIRSKAEHGELPLNSDGIRVKSYKLGETGDMR